MMRNLVELCRRRVLRRQHYRPREGRGLRLHLRVDLPPRGLAAVVAAAEKDVDVVECNGMECVY